MEQQMDEKTRRENNMRIAAALNTVQTAMWHGGRSDWTDEDAEALQKVLQLTDGVLLQEGGQVPAGFGSQVQGNEKSPLRVRGAWEDRLEEGLASLLSQKGGEGG